MAIADGFGHDAAMIKMRAMVVPQAGGRFRLEERDIPVPGPGEVLLRVRACGVCHSDALTVEAICRA